METDPTRFRLNQFYLCYSAGDRRLFKPLNLRFGISP